jgi:hypothetical protein
MSFLPMCILTKINKFLTELVLTFYQLRLDKKRKITANIIDCLKQLDKKYSIV